MMTMVGRGAGRKTGEVAELRRRITALEADNAGLYAKGNQLHAEVDSLRRANQRLRARVEELAARVEALRREAKRQAAPHSRHRPATNPKRPGRKPGVAYGPRAHRPVPASVDEVVTVGLPATCPGCGGQLAVERVAHQYTEDLPPVRPWTIRFEVCIGRCQSCGRRLQPRHPRQASDALGAAGAALGPRAVALAALLHKGLGVPVAKVSRLFAQLGLTVTPGGLTGAIARAARACQPTYQALVEGVRASPVVAPDETGWRVAGEKAWLWAFVGDGLTVYRVARGRGYHDATAVLGEEFAGVIERDGWAPYRKFAHATHQTCLAHLLRRCRELIADADRGQAKTPHAVRRILAQALWLRAARDAGELAAEHLTAEVDRLGAAVDKLVAGATVYPPNRRLLNHLGREREHLFTFLAIPGVEATNWRAEHAIRPRWSPARCGAATVPGPAPSPSRCSPASCGPPTSRIATPSSCSLACSEHQRRAAWLTCASPGTDEHPSGANLGFSCEA
jgi:transposase